MKRTAKQSEAKYIISNPFIPKPLIPPIPRDKVKGNMRCIPLKPIKFLPHQCTNHCVSWTDYNPNKCKSNNPLAIPFIFGFHRLIFRLHKKRRVVYISPCGRRLRSYPELNRYLRKTKCLLTIDQFVFDFRVRCSIGLPLGPTLKSLKDVSHGKENIPISCVNDLDHNYPPYVPYLTERQMSEGVNFNLDKNFLIGCDCTDDCQNKKKCSCWQSTYAGAKYCNVALPANPKIGYQFRRLPERVITGIYECNSQCKCASTCLNRVAQQPLTTQLQLYKTEKKGWGVRTLYDIPKGAFVCTYVGTLFTDQAADERGKNFGDEYLAELDFIETVEKVKEGYESDVSQELLEDSDDNENAQSRPSQEYVPKYPSVRKMFEKHETPYVIDSKHGGNVTRYINHSCNPNLFQQNVFVDTHDLRFPWVAFFSINNIRAGSELSWDYNYEVDSVPGRILYCHCGTNNCRGRLL